MTLLRNWYKMTLSFSHNLDTDKSQTGTGVLKFCLFQRKCNFSQSNHFITARFSTNGNNLKLFSAAHLRLQDEQVFGDGEGLKLYNLMSSTHILPQMYLAVDVLFSDLKQLIAKGLAYELLPWKNMLSTRENHVLFEAMDSCGKTAVFLNEQEGFDLASKLRQKHSDVHVSKNALARFDYVYTLSGKVPIRTMVRIKSVLHAGLWEKGNSLVAKMSIRQGNVERNSLVRQIRNQSTIIIVLLSLVAVGLGVACLTFILEGMISRASQCTCLYYNETMPKSNRISRTILI